MFIQYWVNMASKKELHNGFTLIELSIVIVIIGLVVSAVVAGQSLVKQAKIRSEINMLTEYTVGVNTFYSKFGTIPGDLSSAQDYWGVGTENGNGNKKLEHSVNDQLYNFERPLFFEHLSLSGLINGQYDGSSTLGVGYPVSKIKETLGFVAGYQYRNICTSKQELAFWFSVVTHANMPNINFSDNLVTQEEGLDPIVVSSIDNKIDDGSFTSGKYGAINCTAATKTDACRVCYSIR